MKIGYARVSTRDQKADLQVDALKQAGCERIYQDIASGAKSARPELDKLLANVRPTDPPESARGSARARTPPARRTG
ncbi:recombinase family protein [Stutzerimonas frequens]|uniref:recombinase family protein n=1 Tax=Stutzerimonas frequens TaxID=2968969 RepID=UPI0039C0089B